MERCVAKSDLLWPSGRGVSKGAGLGVAQGARWGGVIGPDNVSSLLYFSVFCLKKRDAKLLATTFFALSSVEGGAELLAKTFFACQLRICTGGAKSDFRPGAPDTLVTPLPLGDG